MTSNIENNSGKISSNLDYIITNMDLIQGKIKNPSYSSEKKEFEFKGKGNLYGSVNKCLNSYFNTTSKLLNKLSNETQTIISMGEKMQELDNELSKKAGEL